MEPKPPLARVIHVRGQSDPSLEEVGELYGRACPALVGLLTAVGGSRADAEEVAQDSFVKLLENWSRVRRYDDPEAWLRTVGVRTMISRHRRRTVATLGLRRLKDEAILTEQPSLDDAIDIERALARLSVGQRAVVLLHHVYDQPVEAVAAQLRLPVGTVKSRLARARAALAPLLTTEERIRR